MTPRIALIHATPLAVEPIRAAFNMLWPQARLMNVLDDTLTADLTDIGRLDVAMMVRFERLASYAVEAGAQAILFTCSAFAPAIENVAAKIEVPVLKPNEAMFAEALDCALAGSRTLGLITTFAPAAASMRRELLDEIRRRGIDLTLYERCIPEAMDALNSGDSTQHDSLIAIAAAELPRCDAIMLGQFSMARAAPNIKAAVVSRVLTSPHSAVSDLRSRLDS